jgi:hypothetical protein
MALGTENLKKVLLFAIKLSEKVDEITQDGFQWQDAVSLFPNLVDAIGVVKLAKDAYVEFLDLDEDEKNDVLAYVKAEFDIADDKLEAVVESALLVVVNVADLISVVKDALKKD